MRITLPRVALAGALALGLSGAAVASVPAPDGQVRACYDAKGNMHLIDAAASDAQMPSTCSDKETPISWNQTGPMGPQGARPRQGRDRRPGPAGSRRPVFVAPELPAKRPAGSDYHTFAFRRLPQGLHHGQRQGHRLPVRVPGHLRVAMVTCRLMQMNADG